MRSGSWVEGGLAIRGAGLDLLAYVLDPVGMLLQHGASFAIEQTKPLRQALDWPAGDPNQIAAYSKTWENVSNAVSGVLSDLGPETLKGVQAWAGAAGDSYRKAVAQQAECLAAAASCDGGEFHVVDGADAAHPDPPVWRIVEDTSVEHAWPSVSRWFTDASQDVLKMRAYAADILARGGSATWARFFDLAG